VLGGGYHMYIYTFLEWTAMAVEKRSNAKEHEEKRERVQERSARQQIAREQPPRRHCFCFESVGFFKIICLLE
jgi:hypothetical protein